MHFRVRLEGRRRLCSAPLRSEPWSAALEPPLVRAVAEGLRRALAAAAEPEPFVLGELLAGLSDDERPSLDDQRAVSRRRDDRGTAARVLARSVFAVGDCSPRRVAR